MFKLLKRLEKKEIIYSIISMALIIGQIFLDLKLPEFMENITLIVKSKGSAIQILFQGLLMLFCAGGSLILSFITGWFISYIAASFSKNLRRSVFSKVQNFSTEEMNKFSIGSLITRTTNDITQIETLLAFGLQLLIKAPLTAILALIKILNKNYTWTAITGGAVAIALITVISLFSLVLPRFKKVQATIDNVNNVTKENLTGIRAVRAFNAEEYQHHKFENHNIKLTKLQTFNQVIMSLMSPIMYLIMNSLTLVIYFTGAYIIQATQVALKIDVFTNMLTFSTYAMQVITSFLMIAMMFMIYPRASVSINRIMEVLDSKIKLQEGEIKSNLTNETGTVEFKNVYFKYPDAQDYTLEDISFKAKKGETVAIIGSTGSGKSTLINLIPRFFDVTSGQVLVDGINVKEYNEEFLLNKIGYVSQKAVLFNQSVADNVAFGNNESYNHQRIKKSIEIAQAKNFVESMKNGYDAIISQGGTNVSGGQKQRLSIARAIYKNPEIYIFDDSFSALDYKTDFELRSQLKKHTKDATSIIVAQRIGTVMNADKILVLEDGKCVGMGTHKQLLKTCKVYKEIAYSQLSKEELENGR